MREERPIRCVLIRQTFVGQGVVKVRLSFQALECPLRGSRNPHLAKTLQS